VHLARLTGTDGAAVDLDDRDQFADGAGEEHFVGGVEVEQGELLFMGRVAGFVTELRSRKDGGPGMNEALGPVATSPAATGTRRWSAASSFRWGGRCSRPTSSASSP